MPVNYRIVIGNLHSLFMCNQIIQAEALIAFYVNKITFENCMKSISMYFQYDTA